jgi:hypothetical protein
LAGAALFTGEIAGLSGSMVDLNNSFLLLITGSYLFPNGMSSENKDPSFLKSLFESVWSSGLMDYELD